MEVRFRIVAGCADCAGDVAHAIEKLAKVRRVVISATAVRVEHDGGLVPSLVLQEAERHGWRLELEDTGGARTEARPRWMEPKSLALAAATVVLVLGLVAQHLARSESIAGVLYLATTAVGGIFPARSAWSALRNKRLTIHALLVAATAGALALGIFGEAALLVVVFSVGEVLEDYAAGRARRAIRSLMDLAPRTAERLRDDGSEKVPVEALAAGDLVLARPGSRIPTDGEVVSGRSAVDQSAVTGESIPVEVAPGAAVFGGTVNGSGALRVRVTKPYAETVLARIIRQVEEAHAAKGGAQRFADRFGGLYTPAMFALAIVVAIVPPLFVGSLHEWVYRALVVLTVSCSCSLVLSVPVAVVASISRAARDGVLIKGGAFLDALAAVRVVAFDKTGTLTHGRPAVTDVLPREGVTELDALRLAASVEASSEHALAAAIVAEARRRGSEFEPAHDVVTRPGVGAEAMIDGARVFVGRPSEAANLAPDIARLEAAGRSVVVVSRDERPLALVAVADSVRPAAAAVVRELRELGVAHVVMLTGDNEGTAAAVARATGIAEWRARLLPEDKTKAVGELRGAHGAVAMIGDGVNDAPALAAADVGVAMGAAGTDVALETADVALMADDLRKLPAAIRLARRGVANLRQNVMLSLLTIAVLVPLALAGVFSLTTGLLANEAMALVVIVNALRLMRSGAPVTAERRPLIAAEEGTR